MIKKILIAVVVLIAVAVGGYFVVTNKTIAFKSVCDAANPKFNGEYCAHVGKRAYTLKNMSAVNEKDFGKIIGVAWRSKGSTVSAPGQQKRTSPRNSYYYIIQQDGGDYVFLRLVSETDPR